MTRLRKMMLEELQRRNYCEDRRPDPTRETLSVGRACARLLTESLRA
jgi:hypothetical protein